MWYWLSITGNLEASVTGMFFGLILIVMGFSKRWRIRQIMPWWWPPEGNIALGLFLVIDSLETLQRPLIELGMTGSWIDSYADPVFAIIRFLGGKIGIVVVALWLSQYVIVTRMKWDGDHPIESEFTERNRHVQRND